MEKKLVQKQLIISKSSFKDELDKIILSLDLPKYSNKTGNKQFTTAQKLSVIILYFRSGKSLRNFCEEFKETKWSEWLKLKYKITKSSVNRWVSEFDLSFIKEILHFTNKGENTELAGIDGSGIETDFKSKYYQKRLDEFGQKPKSNYHKLDIIADMQGKKKILDYEFSMKQRGDSKVAKQLFKRTKLKKTVILGDKGYFSFESIELAKSKNCDFIFPPKNFKGKCKHNNFKHIKIKKNYYKYKDLYNKRSNVEGVFSSLKRTYLERIRSQKCNTKKREMALKIILYNMHKNIFFALNFFKLIFFNKTKKEFY